MRDPFPTIISSNYRERRLCVSVWKKKNPNKLWWLFNKVRPTGTLQKAVKLTADCTV